MAAAVSLWGLAMSEPSEFDQEIQRIADEIGRDELFDVKLAKALFQRHNVFARLENNLTLAKERIRHLEADLRFLSALPAKSVYQALHALSVSQGQIRQDIFALSEHDFKRRGYFVEFGAASGVHLSNTYLLEKSYAWSGIIAEPGAVWQESLQQSRSCHIESKCVWTKSGEVLQFNQVDNDAELSTISDFSNCDYFEGFRRKGTTYSVETISLLDMLRKYDAPRQIDYLSIDTEGSEFDILSAFDFDQYDIAVITCEHNFTENRQKIYDLLTSHGYQRKYEDITQFDDWYVKKA